LRRRDWPIAADALPPLLVLALAGWLLSWLFGPWGWVLPAGCALFVLYFFRDPRRRIRGEGKDLVAPGDGVILSIQRVEEKEYIKGPAIKISVFLSLLNVHVNRCPIAGQVEYSRYQAGKFIPAFKSHASALNERNYLGIRTDTAEGHKILLAQITGFLARRVVCWSRPGDRLERGERFGLIKFGSCVELYLPAGAEVLATEGMKVKGGLDILGRLP
jgi:phosphatidylserine decarboxylase